MPAGRPRLHLARHATTTLYWLRVIHLSLHFSLHPNLRFLVFKESPLELSLGQGFLLRASDAGRSLAANPRDRVY